MNIYHYDRNTKEYLFTGIADADPAATKLKGEFVPLVCANATLIEPPETTKNQVACFINETWIIKPDYRTTHKIVTDQLLIVDITEIGDPQGYKVENELAKEIKNSPSLFMWDGNEVLVKKSSKILLVEAKQTKQQENLNKANEAVLKGYVRYKGCQFETNTDNQSNMTATANLMQAQGIETTQWLSKDNIPIELTLEDFLNIGGLILNYKTNLWTNIYAGFEAQIEAAQTIEEIENIIVNYEN